MRLRHPTLGEEMRGEDSMVLAYTMQAIAGREEGWRAGVLDTVWTNAAHARTRHAVAVCRALVALLSLGGPE